MPVLDIAALLKPIPGSDPGGPPPSEVRDTDARDPTNLLKMRREANALPVEDAGRQKLWRDGMKLAQDLFSTRCKNLDWAIYAVDAAVRSAGLAGAREGFQFLTRLTNECWDWLWPRANLAELEKAEPAERESLLKEMEANAIEARSGRFNSLDDAEGGLLFPNVIREQVLASQDGVVLTVFACRPVGKTPAKLKSDDVQALGRKLGPEQVRAILAEIDGTIADLTALREAAEARFIAADAANLAPSFREVRLALEDCRRIADEMYVAVEGDAEQAKESAPGAAGEPASAGGGKDKITRASLYKQIAQIADHLTRIEPHSPVPYLLRRVVELQELPFPQLVRELTKSSENVLSFLERSLAESPAKY